jgi:hypothetical protein
MIRHSNHLPLNNVAGEDKYRMNCKSARAIKIHRRVRLAQQLERMRAYG